MAVSGTALALRALGLGDLLTAVPALRGLRRSWDGRVVLAAPAGLAPLALHTGAVDEVLDTGPLQPVGCTAPELAVNLHGSGPESTARLRETRPGRLVSYGVTSEWREDEHERVRWARLVTEAGMPADPDDLRLDPVPVASPAPGAVVVHPGAAFGCRRWPAERFAAVVRALVRGGHEVVVTGSVAEAELARSVAGDVATVLAGRTSLLELASLVASARLVVSGDTGTAHLATAFGTPSVVLFGPASPARWSPPPGPHRVLWSGRTGPLFTEEPDPGLLEITPERVLQETARVLA